MNKSNSIPTGYTVGKDGVLKLSEREIPVPTSVSAQAAAFLALAPTFERQEPPPTTDKESWRRFIAHTESGPGMLATDEMIAATGAHLETLRLGGALVYRAMPSGIDAQSRTRVYLDIHGGGLILGAGNFSRLSAARHAMRHRCITYGVDYRMPPEHPFPAGLDDCFAAYRELLTTVNPGQIVIGGISAGGNLAGALALKIRDEGLPLPAGVALMTPELDLTESGDTFQTLRYIDVVLREGLPQFNALYAGGHDLRHPYLSPLFGDFTRGFPPTFIQAGTRDLFLSNAVRMQRALRRAGVEVDLQLWEGMPHGGFGGATAEDEEVQFELSRFLEAHWSTHESRSKSMS